MVGQVLPPEVGLLKGRLEELDDLVLELGELGFVRLGCLAGLIRGITGDTERLTDFLGALLELPEGTDDGFLDPRARRPQSLPQTIPSLLRLGVISSWNPSEKLFQIRFNPAPVQVMALMTFSATFRLSYHS